MDFFRLAKPSDANNKCKKCNYTCYAIHFQHKFIDWTTSGNDDIDRFIQDTQLLTHNNVKEALEWIPYDRLYDIKYIAKDEYGANWIDGYINYWDDKNQNWKRKGHNMIVNLKSLNIPENLTLEFTNEIKKEREYYGITQIQKQKIIRCGSDDIDKFIQDNQLSTHDNAEEVLEWIPYDRLYDIKDITKDKFGIVYRAN
ncbi:unnamed protein product [Rhizophagus irregularis]|nr:unnamed protein product [Rhizophagus irregularis]